jgi:hypothetical protein
MTVAEPAKSALYAAFTGKLRAVTVSRVRRMKLISMFLVDNGVRSKVHFFTHTDE